jgi:hypothetical protein
MEAMDIGAQTEGPVHKLRASAVAEEEVGCRRLCAADARQEGIEG